MNRIKALFQHKNQDILNVYFTAGYPALEDTFTIATSLANAGVDLIEIGMPYSDPLADGPVIQDSSMTALRNGMTLPLLFEQITRIRQHTEVPLVLMGYFNQLLQYGEQRFFEHCAAAGIDGLIIPDLPLPEYRDHYRASVQALNLGMSFLITPQTSNERIRMVDELSDGFIYMVANSATTGAKQDITTAQLDYFQRIQAMQLRNPRLIGFGISNHDTFQTACRYASGAIIGSAFIRALGEAPDNLAQQISQFVRSIRGASAEGIQS